MFLIISDILELKYMLGQLDEASRKVGLRIDLSETKIISDTEDVLTVDGTTLENVESIYTWGTSSNLAKRTKLPT